MFLQWFFQSIVQILYYFIRQIPPHLDVQIDFDRMAECFSAKDPNNPTCRITAKPWRFRSDAKELQDKAELRYERFAGHQRKFMPNGVHLKLGQEARLRAKSLALLGTWGSSASKRAKAPRSTASSPRKRIGKGARTNSKPRKRSQGSSLGLKPTDGSGSSHTAEMSHVEISPLTAAVRRRYVSLSSLPVVQDFNNQDDEWMDVDVDDEDDEDNLRMGDNVSDGGRCSTDKDLEEMMDVDDQEDRMDVDGPPLRTSPEDVSGRLLRKRKC
ncbi:hypothetical protein GSI_13415 [Ganoderma sinense ZZ0214-1]|uniref:Uncharacterized protein n=1 Tax=Ganoderma sinense ZZ0214-1 TaxID=1077348 RepID=A0A2G8RQ85_9APHY|nr:hypothetical protein GSI_13415 [Ganoderma sinense ZZ0214-1]